MTLKALIATAIIATTLPTTAIAQSAFPTTGSDARLSQRSTVIGDRNTDIHRDTIAQSAYASVPQPGALNPHVQEFLHNAYGNKPMFQYNQSFVNQFGYDHGKGNTMTMSYAGRDQTGIPGNGGIDRKVIVAEQIAIQRGDGNTTELTGRISQRGRPIGAGIHGDILDLKLDVATQVGVQVGNRNRLDLSLETEQLDQ